MLNRIRITLIGLLIFAIGISPRIPLPIFIPGRQFDLRFVDVILFIICMLWLLYLALKPHIYITPLAKSI